MESTPGIPGDTMNMPFSSSDQFVERIDDIASPSVHTMFAAEATLKDERKDTVECCSCYGDFVPNESTGLTCRGCSVFTCDECLAERAGLWANGRTSIVAQNGICPTDGVSIPCSLGSCTEPMAIEGGAIERACNAIDATNAARTVARLLRVAQSPWITLKVEWAKECTEAPADDAKDVTLEENPWRYGATADIAAMHALAAPLSEWVRDALFSQTFAELRKSGAPQTWEDLEHANTETAPPKILLAAQRENWTAVYQLLTQQSIELQRGGSREVRRHHLLATLKGWTMLHLAAQSGKVKVVVALLHAVHQADCIDVVLDQKVPLVHRTALFLAAESDTTKAVDDVFGARGAETFVVRKVHADGTLDLGAPRVAERAVAPAAAEATAASSSLSSSSAAEAAAPMDYYCRGTETITRHLQTVGPNPDLGECVVVAQHRIGKFCVGLLGSTAFHGARSEEITSALGAALARVKNLALVTGGMRGVQDVAGRSFEDAKAFGSGKSRLFHISPKMKTAENEDVYTSLQHGQTMRMGRDLAERRSIFAQVCKVYVVMEGGPGTTDEAVKALERGAVVIPIRRSGGAAGGMFNFPLRECKKPDSVADADWAQLSSDSESSPFEVAAAVARMVATCFNSVTKSSPFEVAAAVARMEAPPIDRVDCELVHHALEYNGKEHTRRRAFSKVEASPLGTRSSPARGGASAAAVASAPGVASASERDALRAARLNDYSIAPRKFAVGDRVERTSVFHALLNVGADPWHVDHHKQTVLMAAAMRGHTEAARVLIRHLAYGRRAAGIALHCDADGGDESCSDGAADESSVGRVERVDDDAVERSIKKMVMARQHEGWGAIGIAAWKGHNGVLDTVLAEVYSILSKLTGRDVVRCSLLLFASLVFCLLISPSFFFSSSFLSPLSFFSS
jgi:predicted Rossmann-fold nucleotide-binding protein/ankyrin repeat protein